jgi:transposase
MAKRNEKARAAGVGIDVSKRELVACVRREGGAEKILRAGNDAAGARKLLAALGGCACRVVIEATSHYSWLAAVTLSEAGMDVRVINPILTAKYSKSGVRMVKSDPADAATLALMAESDPKLPARFSATREGLAWRKEYGLFETLRRKCSEMRVAVAGAREAAASLGLDASADLAPAEVALRALDAAARKAGAALAARAAALSGGLAERLATIPGVSMSAAGLACQLLATGGGRDAKSWVGFVGLDVSVRESGSWRGRARLTKRGSPALRRRLFCAAWGAVMHDGRFGAYYGSLRAAGRSYVEALVIVARKIVRLMFRISSEPGATYDEAKAFPAPKPAAA